MNKKDRRHSGRIFPRLKGCPQKELDKEGIAINPEYDDWKDRRDGFRNHICKKCGERLHWQETGDFCNMHKRLAKLSKKQKRFKL